jgi:hypothetical protein
MAWRLPEAQVGKEVGVSAGEAGDAPEGIDAAKQGQQDEGEQPPEGVLPIVSPRVGDALQSFS